MATTEQVWSLYDAFPEHMRAMAIGRRAGEPGLSASALEGLARLAVLRGDRDQAQRLVADAAELRLRFGRPAPPHEREDLELAGVGGSP